MNFNNILIGSEDAGRLAEYYTKLFGTPGWDDGGYVGWVIGTGGVTVGPHSEVHGPNAQPGRLIWNIESPDVQADFERFKAAGAIVIREPYDVRGCARDPDRDLRRSGRQLLPAHQPVRSGRDGLSCFRAGRDLSGASGRTTRAGRS